MQSTKRVAMLKKIAIVVGHRKSKRGAYGSGGLTEYEYNSIFARTLVAKINNETNAVAEIFYRQDERGYRRNMKELHKRIDAWGATDSVELHFNGFSNPKVKGHEVLYYSKRGKRSAKILNDSLEKRIVNTRDRGIKRAKTKKDNGYWFLRYGKSVCVLSEPFFAAEQKYFMHKSNGYNNLLNAYTEWAVKLSLL